MKQVVMGWFAILLSALWCTAGHAMPPPRAEAILMAKSGSSVQGRVSFLQLAQGVLVRVEGTGFEPGSEHGFHIHATGDCSALDASSAGGHFAPYHQPHGHPNHGPHHAGDMPNLVADALGQVHTHFIVDDISLYNNQVQNVVGLSVVVHATRDNYYSQPAGNSGPRIACGEIVRK